jgi:hypothetical protein
MELNRIKIDRGIFGMKNVIRPLINNVAPPSKKNCRNKVKVSSMYYPSPRYLSLLYPVFQESNQPFYNNKSTSALISPDRHKTSRRKAAYTFIADWLMTRGSGCRN